MKKDKNRIWRLLGKKVAGEATEEELRELEQLIKENPELGFQAEIASNLKNISVPENKELDESFKRVAERLIMRENKEEIASPGKQKITDTRPNWSRTGKLLYPFSNGMIANYFKIAWRNLTRRKAFSFINIFGLSIGMASATLILLWIHNEMSYDLFHSKKDRIYKVMNRVTIDGGINVWGSTPMVMAPVLQEENPQIEETVRTNWVAAFILKTGDKQIQTHGFLTDPGFLNVFDFPLKEGNAKTALANPHSIVISDKLAKQMYGDDDAMGRVIKIDSNALFTITGVLKPMPANTQLEFDYLVPWSYMKEIKWDEPDWGNISVVQTYVLLKPGVTEKMVNDRIGDIYKKHSDLKYEAFLHPLRKWRLWSEFTNGKISGGGIDTVRMFGIIAAFILLIACINYMNLSTARSVKRAREVGIRKVSGAAKGSLVGQFLGEAILISFLAAIIAIILVQLSMGWFKHVTYETLVVPYKNPGFWLSALGFIFFTGLLAGSYPAFYLSSYKPIRVLNKSYFKSLHALITPRKILVVLQFTFAILLTICTIVIYNQIEHARHRDSGYNRENLAFAYVKGAVEEHYPMIRDEMMKSGAITSITRTNSPVTEIWQMTDDYHWKGQDLSKKDYIIRYYTDNSFVKTLQLKMVAGRDIDALSYPTDSTAIMLNETAVKVMGFKDPIGQVITGHDNSLWHVVGVVKDFIPGTPFQPLLPIIIQGPGKKNWFGTMTF
ncbi:MAG: ABC transporter permease, partial [Chitinophagaceae bacterium]